jgi:hypothetical protein
VCAIGRTLICRNRISPAIRLGSGGILAMSGWDRLIGSGATEGEEEMKIKVERKAIAVEIDGRKIEMSEAEARELRDKLSEALNEPRITYVPYPYPYYPQFEPYKITWTVPYTVPCTSSGSGTPRDGATTTMIGDGTFFEVGQ